MCLYLRFPLSLTNPSLTPPQPPLRARRMRPSCAPAWPCAQKRQHTPSRP